MYKIAELRKAQAVRAVELADRLGISQPYLSQLENGKRRPSAEMLSQIAQVLSVPVQALYADRPTTAVAGRVGAGARVELVDSYEKGAGLYHVVTPADLPVTGLVAVEVEGDSMEPLIRPKDILFFTRAFQMVDPSALGHVSICETEDGRALVKQITRGQEDDLYNLFSANNLHPPEYGVQLIWAARLRRHLPSEDVQTV